MFPHLGCKYHRGKQREDISMNTSRDIYYCVCNAEADYMDTQWDTNQRFFSSLKAVIVS